MEMTTSTTAAAADTSFCKSPEQDMPTPFHQGKPAATPFSNGVLKRHRQQNAAAAAAVTVTTTYRECLRNHAASLGGHAVDGCGEFMPSPSATSTDPTSLKCAACGCHRNFHRRDPEDSSPPRHRPLHASSTRAIEYHPHHRHQPPPPPRSPGHSASPPPISSSYAPHMLLALSTGGMHPPPLTAHPHLTAMNMIMPDPTGRRIKRFRTKFSQAQKERMFEFAGRIGWKIHKSDEDLIRDFCNEVGVERNVLKVWMHNNKNTLGRRDESATQNGGGGRNGGGENHSSYPYTGTNGSSSSS
ncbi:hypothetical protein SAY87_021648 [Trapa incisa]|uniref:ZF-HD dimerization-type domain-containing protein n=1 Tax=Trapa incisa TaxID=236973 RepID=A0AAN7JRB8_9MYRT|nr:hypothetical protein SAY87_021648 [Trapa incisa]